MSFLMCFIIVGYAILHGETQFSLTREIEHIEAFLVEGELFDLAVQ